MTSRDDYRNKETVMPSVSGGKMQLKVISICAKCEYCEIDTENGGHFCGNEKHSVVDPVLGVSKTNCYDVNNGQCKEFKKKEHFIKFEPEHPTPPPFPDVAANTTVATLFGVIVGAVLIGTIALIYNALTS